MRDTYVRLRASQPFRYVFIGGISYVIELSILLSLATFFLLSPEVSVACSFWVGLITSFLLQKYFAFRSRANDRKTIGKQSILYGALVVFNYSFTIAFVSIFTIAFGLVIARTIALLLTVTWNYFIYKRIFR